MRRTTFPTRLSIIAFGLVALSLACALPGAPPPTVTAPPPTDTAPPPTATVPPTAPLAAPTVAPVAVRDATSPPLPFDGFRSYAGLHVRHQDLAVTSPWVHPVPLGETRQGRTIWLYQLGDANLHTPGRRAPEPRPAR